MEVTMSVLKALLTQQARVDKGVLCVSEFICAHRHLCLDPNLCADCSQSYYFTPPTHPSLFSLCVSAC